MPRQRVQVQRPGSRRTSSPRPSSSPPRRPRGGRCRPSSGRRRCAGPTRGAGPRGRPHKPRRAGCRAPRRFRAAAGTRPSSPGAPSSESFWKSGSSVAMYAACACSRFIRRPSPKRRTLSSAGYRRHRHRVPRPPTLVQRRAARSPNVHTWRRRERARPGATAVLPRPPRASPSSRLARTTYSGPRPRRPARASVRRRVGVAVDASVVFPPRT